MTTKDIQIRLRARLIGSTAQVKTLIHHPMESGLNVAGQSKDKAPAPHYLTSVRLEVNGALIALAHLGPGVSHEPLFGWRVSEARPGDRVRVTWTNNRGETGSAETLVQ